MSEDKVNLLDESDLEVAPENAFKYDAFNRKPQAEYLSTIVTKVSHPFVLLINGQWGTGKSTFIRMWNSHLKSNGNKTIVYDAWKSDFSPDPFIDIISEVSNSLPGQTDDLKAKGAKLAKHLLKRTLPAAVKLATAGILDLNSLTEDVLSEVAENIASDSINSYLEAKGSSDEFKQSLQKILRDADNDTNTIFFVDELDRCRPTYALEVLERIKHYFRVPGLVFVICADLNQLKASIKKLYGSETDSDSYLKKFFDLEVSLAHPKKDVYIAKKFEEIEIRNTELLKRYGQHRLVGYAQNLDKLFKTSARELNQIIRLFYFTTFYLEEDIDSFAIDLILLLHFFRISKPSLFEEYEAGTLNYKLLEASLLSDLNPELDFDDIENLLLKLEVSLMLEDNFDDFLSANTDKTVLIRHGYTYKNLCRKSNQRRRSFPLKICKLIRETTLFVGF